MLNHGQGPNKSTGISRSVSPQIVSIHASKALTMEMSFSAKDYVQTLAQELVEGFAKAGKATTPGLVGSAREKAVRNKLEQIFPQAVGVASGCIIDADNHTSKQTDIILYEKEICPVFSINDNPETTYFPCESVIAIGEVKSTLGTSELKDSFAKIESVKHLRRHYKDVRSFRSYCSRTVFYGTGDESYNQFEKPYDQIYGFIICDKIGLSLDTFFTKCREEIKKRPSNAVPNMIVSLSDGVLVYMDSKTNRSCTDSAGADYLYFVNKPGLNFQQLLVNLNLILVKGRTTDVFPFEKYVIDNTNYPAHGRIFPLGV